MKKIALIIVLIITISCNNKKENKIDSDKPQKEKQDKKKYDIITFVNELGNDKRSETTAYISKDDTIYTQTKLFENDIIDTINSHFYDFELYEIGNNTYSGKITLYSHLDNLKNNYSNHLVLSFLKIDEEFESKNQNFVEFKFKSKTDTLMGVLTEFRNFDTIINGEEMVRMTQTYVPIDTKTKTYNPFIEGFKIEGIKFK